jgi:hypothetical protein
MGVGLKTGILPNKDFPDFTKGKWKDRKSIFAIDSLGF